MQVEAATLHRRGQHLCSKLPRKLAAWCGLNGNDAGRRGVGHAHAGFVPRGYCGAPDDQVLQRVVEGDALDLRDAVVCVAGSNDADASGEHALAASGRQVPRGAGAAQGPRQCQGHRAGSRNGALVLGPPA